MGLDKRQQRIEDFFKIVKPKRGMPVSVLNRSASQGSMTIAREYRFATIMELPSEILLSILDHLIVLDFETLDCPVFSVRISQPTKMLASLDLDAPRRLYSVCRRFYHVFGGFVFQNIRCIGTTQLHRLNVSLNEKALPNARTKQLHISFLRMNEINFQAVKEQLIPCIQGLPNLTAVTLDSVILNVELIHTLGSLNNLSSLVYQISYPYQQLASNERYGSFSIGQLQRRHHLIPSRLRSLHVEVSCIDEEFVAQMLLMEIIKASSQSLRLISINLCDGEIGRSFDLSKVFDIEFPNLINFAIYHTNTSWHSIETWWKEYSPSLNDVRILAHHERVHETEVSDADSDFPSQIIYRLKHLPGMQCVKGRAARWRIEQSDSLIELDPSGNLTLREVSLVQGKWEMLYYIGRQHPFLRVVNIWDASLARGIFVLDEFIRASQYLGNIETFRFNFNADDMENNGIPELPPLLDCQCAGVPLCSECSCYMSGMHYSVDLDIHPAEWEETNWPPFQDLIQQLANLFPKLKLVEWFVVDSIYGMDNRIIPFWRWEIIEQSIDGHHRRFLLRRSFRNWKYAHPFDNVEPWIPQRGIQYADNIDYEEYKR